MTPTKTEIDERAAKLNNQMLDCMFPPLSEIQWDPQSLKDEWLIRKLAELDLKIEALTKQ